MDVRSRAMLTSLHMTMWGARRYDYSSQDELSKWTHANTTMVSVSKQLVPAIALREIKRLHQRARRTFDQMTTPWFDDGTRMLPAMSWMTFTETMIKHQNAVETGVAAFINTYEEQVEKARDELTGLGKLFNANDYPTVEELRKKFSFRIITLPMPTTDDFRMTMAQDEIDCIKEDLQTEMNKAMGRSTEAILDRFEDVMSHLAERMKPGTPFKQKSLDNVKAAIGLGRAMNVLQNKALDEIMLVMERVTHHDAIALRTDERLCTEYAQHCKVALWFINKERKHASGSHQEEPSPAA